MEAGFEPRQFGSGRYSLNQYARLSLKCHKRQYKRLCWIKKHN